jgi:hypothetical protein
MIEPLIHTTMGNVPVSSLAHEVEWRFTEKIAHFTERYKDSTGAIVRQDSHVYAFGADAESAATPQQE